ncbi:MAG: tRNA pseudouridine(55) synthase TruB [Candidatus Marinimicrobia bacterium]|nr:tRNA pseudouridine(55) synthase TruB [Candidatus Neomarinimicrobiota bacterium]|tara:strand:+ start:374 stop:1036 length:663 start_codon:yes stop_codon:yes gene_type:complete
MKSNNLNDKIFSVWKPSGILSNEIVYKIRENYSIKAGHAGTLDPFAEGVIVVCTGNKTKEIPRLQLKKKKYTAKIKLGAITDTLDCDGQIVFRKKIPNISIKDVNNCLNRFVGKIMQRPPAFSALRRNNVRLYKLARQGILINLKPREVYIDSLILKEFNKSFLIVDIVCNSGTYIRSLARDISSSLNTYGYLDSLTRQYIGKYKRENSYSYNEILNESL